MTSVRKQLVTQLSQKEVSLNSCLTTSMGTCLQSVFEASVECGELPAYWTNLIKDVS